MALPSNDHAEVPKASSGDRTEGEACRLTRPPACPEPVTRLPTEQNGKKHKGLPAETHASLPANQSSVSVFFKT